MRTRKFLYSIRFLNKNTISKTSPNCLISANIECLLLTPKPTPNKTTL